VGWTPSLVFEIFLFLIGTGLTDHNETISCVLFNVASACVFPDKRTLLHCARLQLWDFNSANNKCTVETKL